MAFEYEDDDLGLEEEELEEEQSYQPEDEIAEYLRRLYAEDEGEEDEQSANDPDIDTDDLDDLTNDHASKDNDSKQAEGQAKNPSGKETGTKKNIKGAQPGSTPSSSGGGFSNFANKLSNMFGKGGGLGGSGAGASAASGAASKAAGQAATKAAGAGAKALLTNPYFWAVVGALLLIIIIIVVITSIDADIEQKEEEGMYSVQNITSEYFYGMRLVYDDEQALSNELQLSYKQYAVDLLGELGENADITLNITLPQLNFDNASEIDSNIANISIAIGNIVANNNEAYEGVEFSTLYPNISQFGFTADNLTNINTFISNYITANNIITLAEGSGVVVSDEINAISASAEFAKYQMLCDKIMIKDVLVQDKLPAFGENKYIACFYMPKTSVTVSDMAYRIKVSGEEDVVSFKLINLYNGSSNILIDETADYSWNDGMGYVQIDDSVKLDKFNSIDDANTGAFSEGISLFGALKTESNKQYFSQTGNSYSYMPNETNLLYLTFDSSVSFQFNEFYIEEQAG